MRPECIVAIGHMTDDAVQAEDAVTAIDVAWKGQGLEMDAETRDASISACQGSAPRRPA